MGDCGGGAAAATQRGRRWHRHLRNGGGGSIAYKETTVAAAAAMAGGRYRLRVDPSIRPFVGKYSSLYRKKIDADRVTHSLSLSL